MVLKFSKPSASPVIRPYEGGSLYVVGRSVNHLSGLKSELNSEAVQHRITPQCRMVREILAPAIPRGSLLDLVGLPWFTTQESCQSKWEVIEQLNAEELCLSPSFFLTNQDDGSDTALSSEGLNAFMADYSKEKHLEARVYMSQQDFVRDMTALHALAQKASVACVVCFHESKRHVTGCFIQREKTTNQLRAYFFDSTGLTLPAVPCGMHSYSGSFIPTMQNTILALKNAGIESAVMPINTTKSIQNDPYSCFMSTLLFFDGMQAGAYQPLLTPGITEGCYKAPTTAALQMNSDGRCGFLPALIHDVVVTLYTMSYLPLLAGVQSRLALLMMLDPLEKAEELFPKIVRYQTDWQRKREWPHEEELHSINVFWQVAYIELLKWFASCQREATHKRLPYPDFMELSKNGCPDRQERSGLEELVPWPVPVVGGDAALGSGGLHPRRFEPREVEIVKIWPKVLGGSLVFSVAAFLTCALVMTLGTFTLPMFLLGLGFIGGGLALAGMFGGGTLVVGFVATEVVYSLEKTETLPPPPAEAHHPSSLFGTNAAGAPEAQDEVIGSYDRR